VIPAINRRSIFEYPYWDLHINLPLVHKLALMPPRGEGRPFIPPAELGGILAYFDKARELCQAVFKITNQSDFKKDFSLRDQIWRAAGATMDNIAEGFDDGSTRELIRFLGYSQRSCSEVQSQLYRALDCKYVT